MYITRMALNPQRREAQRLLSSPYRIHAAVEAAFPPDIARKADEGRILWRVDVTQGGRVFLYLVSPEKPDLTHVVEQAGWPAYPDWETKDYSTLLDSLTVGQRWAFRLKANPARVVKVDKGRTKREGIVGKVQGHVTADQQMKWLLDRCQTRGFVVLEDEAGGAALTVSDRRRDVFARGQGKVTIDTARFDGGLQITDVDAFRNALCFGMGRARSFGCGLLTIAPLDQ